MIPNPNSNPNPNPLAGFPIPVRQTPIRAFRCPLAAYDQLKEMATQGYYLYLSNKGISPFIEELATVPWECNPTIPIVNHPQGAVRSVSISPATIPDFEAILTMYGIYPRLTDPSSIIGTVFTNMSSGFLYPSRWPSRLEHMPAQLLEQVPLPDNPSPTKERIVLFLRPDTMLILASMLANDPTQMSPQATVSHELTKLASSNTPLQDTRPPTLQELSRASEAHGLPPLWDDPLAAPHNHPHRSRSYYDGQLISTYITVPAQTTDYLINQATTHQIPHRTKRHSRNTLIAALLEAMADGYLTPAPTTEATQ
jgi:hypothetical protein